MIWPVPVELEDAVLAASAAELGPAALATGVLAKAIADRAARYTSDREHLSAPADPRADLAARAAFYTIADAIKIAIPLGELAGRGALPARTPLRIVDVGAGCGAMVLGLLAAPASNERSFDVIAIDRDAAAMRIAAAAIRAYGGSRVTIATRKEEIATCALPAADLVLLGTVLNELPAPARLAVVERAISAIGEDGAVIIIEPALRSTARALHELRDAVLARQLAHVFAPCTRAIAPCPMLERDADWCHEDRLVKLPPRTAELARITHLRDGGLKFSYLLLRRATAPLVAPVVAATAWRVVGAPVAPKGKTELAGCGEPGLVTLRLMRRHRTERNRSLERAHRGDVLVVAGATPDPDRLEVTSEATVDRVEPSG